MAVGTLITCPNCRKTFTRKAREHFCSIECRFWHKVQIKGPDQCWPWRGTTPAFGHGQFVADGKVVYAHRFAWQLTNGTVPSGLCVLHKCDVPECVNPQHLFLGSREENLTDMRAKGRGSKPPRLIGTRHHQAKVTEQTVRAIRASTDDQLTLSKRYGITRRSVNRIINRKSWAHVK
jgi:hypothetical protein